MENSKEITKEKFLNLSEKQRDVYSELENLLFDFKADEVNASYAVNKLLDIVTENVSK